MKDLEVILERFDNIEAKLAAIKGYLLLIPDKSEIEKLFNLQKPTSAHLMVEKEEPKDPVIGYGYMPITDKETILIEGDEWFSEILGEWLPTTSIGKEINTLDNNCPYRRPIPIPEGFELVHETENTKSDDKVWRHNSEYYAVIRKVKTVEPAVEEMNKVIYQYLNLYCTYIPQFHTSWDLLIPVINTYANITNDLSLSEVIFNDLEKAHKKAYTAIVNLNKK